MNTSVLLVLVVICVEFEDVRMGFHDRSRIGRVASVRNCDFLGRCGFVYMGMISCIGSQSLGIYEVMPELVVDW